MFFFKSNNKMVTIPLLVIPFVITAGVLSFTGLMDEKSLFLNVFAQETSESVANSSNVSTSASDSSSNSPIEQNESKTVMASGHFANNQIKDGVVKWIQGGLWNLEINNASNKNIVNSNMSATFNANFTMIKPDGSLSHNHLINNLTSDNIIFAGNDIVVTGISHISSNNGTEYEQVPIAIHLMGKKVLGLMIDVNKTGGHFSGTNEMYGTLISGIGLNKSNTIDKNKSAEINNPPSMDSMSNMRH